MITMYKSHKPDCLTNPIYEEFSVVSRSMHDEDAEECIRLQSLVSFTVPKEARSFLSKSDWEVLWFGVSQNPNKHDWYGNISFQILFTDLLEFYGPRLQCYFIDRVVFPFSSSSRILLTENTINSNHIIRLDFSQREFPIWRDSFGKFYHAKQCEGKKHNVEFLIDATAEVAKWLFLNCYKIPVNHIDANLCEKNGGYRKGICHKFNKFGKTCPTSTDLNTTRERFDLEHPGFLRDDVDADYETTTDSSSSLNQSVDFDTNDLIYDDSTLIDTLYTNYIPFDNIGVTMNGDIIEQLVSASCIVSPRPMIKDCSCMSIPKMSPLLKTSNQADYGEVLFETDMLSMLNEDYNSLHFYLLDPLVINNTVISRVFISNKTVNIFRPVNSFDPSIFGFPLWYNDNQFYAATNYSSQEHQLSIIINENDIDEDIFHECMADMFCGYIRRVINCGENIKSKSDSFLSMLRDRCSDMIISSPYNSSYLKPTNWTAEIFELAAMNQQILEESSIGGSNTDPVFRSEVPVSGSCTDYVSFDYIGMIMNNDCTTEACITPLSQPMFGDCSCMCLPRLAPIINTSFSNDVDIEFETNFLEVLQKMNNKIHYYFIDSIKTDGKVISRILVTRNNVSTVYPVMDFNPNNQGYPLWFDGNNLHAATKYNNLDHEVLIILSAFEDINSHIFHDCMSDVFHDYMRNTINIGLRDVDIHSNNLFNLCCKYKELGESLLIDTGYKKTIAKISERIPNIFKSETKEDVITIDLSLTSPEACDPNIDESYNDSTSQSPVKHTEEAEMVDCIKPQSGLCMDYVPIKNIGTTLHDDDIESSTKAGYLLTPELSQDSCQCLAMPNLKPLLFTTNVILNSHNSYGNVCFLTNLSEIQNRIGEVSYYFIDCVLKHKTIVSRVLITKKGSENVPNTAISFRITDTGFPLWYNDDKFYVSTKYDLQKHEALIMVDADQSLRMHLFYECERNVVNHGNVNIHADGSYMPHSCRKFNSVNKECPFASGNKKTKERILSKYPDFFDVSKNKSKLEICKETIISCIKPCADSTYIYTSYVALEDVETAIHIDEVAACVEAESLVFSEVLIGDCSCLAHLQMKTIILSPNRLESAHHSFGSVSFETGLSNVVNKIGPTVYYYYIDTLLAHKKMISRIFITDENASVPNNFLHFDPTLKGFPIWQINNEFCVASKHNSNMHEVQILINATHDMCKWLFQECKRKAVNHGCANILINGCFGPYNCWRYNGRGLACSWNDDMKKTKSRLNEENIGFLQFQTEIDADDYENTRGIVSNESKEAGDDCVQLQSGLFNKYIKLKNVETTMHDEEVVASSEAGYLVSHDINMGNCFCLSSFLQSKLLNFTNSVDSSKHNCYGNVSFETKFSKIIDSINGTAHYYYVDSIFADKKVISRILITNGTIGGLNQFVSFNPVDDGAPIKRINNEYKVATKHDSQMIEVLIMVVASQNMRKDFFKDCCRKSANHGDCNKYVNNSLKSHCCWKYNRNNLTCPNSTGSVKTKSRINKKVPGFFESRSISTNKLLLQKNTLDVPKEILNLPKPVISSEVINNDQEVLHLASENNNNIDDSSLSHKMTLANNNAGQDKTVLQPGVGLCKDYVCVNDIGTAMHDDDVEATTKSGHLVSPKLPPDACLHLPIQNTNPLIFTTNVIVGSHNSYGNVCFQTELHELLNEMNGVLYFYFIDSVIINKKLFSRIFISKRSVAVPRTCILFDPEILGFPLLYDGSLFYTATRYSGRKLQVLLYIDATPSLREYLFNTCKRVAVNHGDILLNGTRSAYLCWKFSGVGYVCPFATGSTKTKGRISLKVPGFFEYGTATDVKYSKSLPALETSNSTVKETCITPLSPTFKLVYNHYKMFKNVGTTMHDDDVQACFNAASLLPQEILPEFCTCLSTLDIKALLFMITKNDDCINSYGNVCFSTELKSIIDRMQGNVHYYLIDVIHMNKKAVSRILITEKPVILKTQVKPFNIRTTGYPIWYYINQFYIATEFNGTSHEVLLIIDAPKQLANDLYCNCKRRVVNHGSVNFLANGRYLSHLCWKYNGKGKECPFATGNTKTRKRINEKIPGFL